MSPSPESVLVDVAGQVATVTLNVPERLNAVDAAMIDAALAQVSAVDADPAVRVIALTGAGRGFCSGADLSPATSEGAGAELRIEDATLFAAGRLSTALMTSATPTVALVNGPAAGVGVAFALACDYTLASASASFTLAFTRIGLMPDGGATALVAANVGRARALRMALTAERVPAATARDWGLIAECVEDGTFEQRSRALLAAFAEAPPAAMAATAAAVTAASVDLAAALAIEEPGQVALLATEDFRQGVAAFIEKRPARFTGR